MRAVPLPSCLLALAAAAACAAPRGPSPQQPDHPSGPVRHYQAGGGEWGDRLLVEAMLLPAVWLQRDGDGAPQVDTDQYTGFGYGLRAAIGNRDQSLGLCYQGFDTETDRTDLQAHSFGFDADVRLPVQGTRGMLFGTAGAGVGAAWLDTSGSGSLGSDLSAQLRVGFDVQPNERFALGMDLGGIVFGHPGETEVYGAFVTIDATFTF